MRKNATVLAHKTSTDSATNLRHVKSGTESSPETRNGRARRKITTRTSAQRKSKVCHFRWPIRYYSVSNNAPSSSHERATAR